MMAIFTKTNKLILKPIYLYEIIAKLNKQYEKSLSKTGSSLVVYTTFKYV